MFLLKTKKRSVMSVKESKKVLQKYTITMSLNVNLDYA